MRKAVRAIIIKNSKLLVMHRNKFGTEYETLPGGNIEIGETPEQALIRELHDETQFEVSNLRLVFIEHCEHPYGDQLIYLADTSGTEPKLLPGSEEDLINKLGKNLYMPMWLPLHDLKRLPFATEELKSQILLALSDGWPETPKEFHSKRI
jgi:ADP-ribose pyrophosphatase YjhB (NUDIX family)